MTDQQLLEFNPSDVFTPDSISKRMSSYLYGNGTLLEPAVGKGHLLKFINIDSYSVSYTHLTLPTIYSV